LVTFLLKSTIKCAFGTSGISFQNVFKVSPKKKPAVGVFTFLPLN